MKVKFVGFGGYMDTPVYEDENGKLYFDENHGRYGFGLNLYTGAWKDPECNEICGEPCNRVTEPVECDEPFVSNPRSVDYALLSRLKRDCDYFLGYGNGYEGHLYYNNVEKHCDQMEKLWNSFSATEKPEWLSLEMIHEYKEKMLKRRKNERV